MLFVQDQYQYLIKKLIHQEHYVFSQFENQEFMLKLESTVYGQKCIVLGSLTACAVEALQLLFLIHTLSVFKAKHITLFSPYLGYQRQDRLDEGSSRGLEWADTMLHAAGVEQIVTIDVHNNLSLFSLKVPIVSYNAECIFEEEITYFISLGFSFVFPDRGAALRYHSILERFSTVPQAFFVKSRLHGVLKLQEFYGRFNRKVIICDDILDSGQTLIQICIALRQLGVEEIIIFVTHAFFHGQAWNDLWNLGVIMLYCTDSVPAAQSMHHFKIHKKSVALLLQKSI